MTNKQWNIACLSAVDIVKSVSPVDTGNLKNNGVTYAFLDNDTFMIKIDLAKAPYMPYTNEPWLSTNHGKWLDKETGGVKKNPNEGWWENAVKKVVEYIAQALGGEIQ